MKFKLEPADRLPLAMTNDPIIKDIHNIVNWLDDHMENGPRNCGDLYCGTCGGVYGTVKKNMPRDIESLLRSTMGKISDDQLMYFSIYGPLIEALEPGAFKMLRRNKILNIDWNDEISVDRYLIEARHSYTLQEQPFRELVDHAIGMAVSTRNKSLCESLVIVLRNELAEHSELLELALEFAKTDSQMRRALFNCTREAVPEARKFSKDAQGFFYEGFVFQYIPPEERDKFQVIFEE